MVSGLGSSREGDERLIRGNNAERVRSTLDGRRGSIPLLMRVPEVVGEKAVAREAD
jgi:hypothetical protein